VDPNDAARTLPKLHKSINQSFTKLNDDLKEIYLGLNKYAKAVEKARLSHSLALPLQLIVIT